MTNIGQARNALDAVRQHQQNWLDNGTMPTKDIPLLFTLENRISTRAGIKTQTRRLPRKVEGVVPLTIPEGTRCPYGDPENEEVRYWVKEPVQVVDLSHGSFVHPWANLTYLDDPPSYGPSHGLDISFKDFNKLHARKDYRRPTSSLLMLKSFTRTWLKGRRTWVERLGDIRAVAAICEGIEFDPEIQVNRFHAWDNSYWRDYLNGGYDLNPVQSYLSLWESIHGEGSWNPDQEVWCVEWDAPLVVD